MSEHTQELLDLAAAYALGAVDGSDLGRFEAHLADGCEACESELDQFFETADALVGGLAPVAAFRGNLDQLLERARSEDPDHAHASVVGINRPPAGARRAEPSGASRSTGSWLRMAASVAGVGLLIALSVQLRSVSVALEEARSALHLESITRKEAQLLAERGAETEIRLLIELAAVREENESRAAYAAADLARLDRMVGTTTSVSRREVALASTGEVEGAGARAIVDPETGGLVLVVDNLPALPQGKTYQLWVIVEGAPISVGIFNLKPDGTTRFGQSFYQDLSPGVTIAVSIEPDGGVPQPTGPIVLAGN